MFAGSGIWGIVADRWGRRPAIILPAILAIVVIAVLLGPQTRGRALTIDLRVLKLAEVP